MSFIQQVGNIFRRKSNGSDGVEEVAVTEDLVQQTLTADTLQSV